MLHYIPASQGMVHGANLTCQRPFGLFCLHLKMIGLPGEIPTHQLTSNVERD